MKMGSGLVASAAMLVVLAASPAFAGNRHRPRLDSQVMRITNSPTEEPIVAPPVTVPGVIDLRHSAATTCRGIATGSGTGDLGSYQSD